MTLLRKEVTDFIRYSDILLHSGMANGPLAGIERGLLEAYIMRLTDELKLSPDISPQWDKSQPDRRGAGQTPQQSTVCNDNDAMCFPLRMMVQSR